MKTFEIDEYEKVLIVGSGFSALEYNDYPYVDKGWVVATINNGWKATNDTHHLSVFSTEIKNFPKWPDKISTSDYLEVLAKYGGARECGYSSMIAISYYVLEVLSPKIIGYLGADMIYSKEGHGSNTCIYGIGEDIAKRGISDPDQLQKVYGYGDPHYLTNLFKRFEDIALENDCLVYNLSSMEQTRLPYLKTTPSEIDKEN